MHIRRIVIGPLAAVSLLLLCAFFVNVRRYQSAHFVVTVPVGMAVDRIVPELEGAYEHVREFGLPLPTTVEVQMHATTTGFCQATGGTAVLNAATIGRVLHLQPADVLVARPGMVRTLRHELAHVALADAAETGGLPRWLNEGIAMAAADQTYGETVRFASIAALEDSLRGSTDQSVLRSAYGTSARLARRLIADHGRSAVLALVLGTHGSFAQRFRTLTGESPSQWTRAHTRHG